MGTFDLINTPRTQTNLSIKNIELLEKIKNILEDSSKKTYVNIDKLADQISLLTSTVPVQIHETITQFEKAAALAPAQARLQTELFRSGFDNLSRYMASLSGIREYHRISLTIMQSSLKVFLETLYPLRDIAARFYQMYVNKIKTESAGMKEISKMDEEDIGLMDIIGGLKSVILAPFSIIGQIKNMFKDPMAAMAVISEKQQKIIDTISRFYESEALSKSGISRSEQMGLISPVRMLLPSFKYWVLSYLKLSTIALYNIARYGYNIKYPFMYRTTAPMFMHEVGLLPVTEGAQRMAQIKEYATLGSQLGGFIPVIGGLVSKISGIVSGALTAVERFKISVFEISDFIKGIKTSSSFETRPNLIATYLFSTIKKFLGPLVKTRQERVKEALEKLGIARTPREKAETFLGNIFPDAFMELIYNVKDIRDILIDIFEINEKEFSKRFERMRFDPFDMMLKTTDEIERTNREVSKLVQAVMRDTLMLDKMSNIMVALSNMFGKYVGIDVSEVLVKAARKFFQKDFGVLSVELEDLDKIRDAVGTELLYSQLSEINRTLREKYKTATIENVIIPDIPLKGVVKDLKDEITSIISSIPKIISERKLPEEFTKGLSTLSLMEMEHVASGMRLIGETKRRGRRPEELMYGPPPTRFKETDRGVIKIVENLKPQQSLLSSIREILAKDVSILLGEIYTISDKQYAILKGIYNSIELYRKYVLQSHVEPEYINKMISTIKEGFETIPPSPTAEDIYKAVRMAFANLPKFAEGGVVDKPTLGIIGEKGAEIIVPLRKFVESGLSFVRRGTERLKVITESKRPIVESKIEKLKESKPYELLAKEISKLRDVIQSKKPTVESRLEEVKKSKLYDKLNKVLDTIKDHLPSISKSSKETGETLVSIKSKFKEMLSKTKDMSSSFFAWFTGLIMSMGIGTALKKFAQFMIQGALKLPGKIISIIVDSIGAIFKGMAKAPFKLAWGLTPAFIKGPIISLVELAASVIPKIPIAGPALMSLGGAFGNVVKFGLGRVFTALMGALTIIGDINYAKEGGPLEIFKTIFMGRRGQGLFERTMDMSAKYGMLGFMAGLPFGPGGAVTGLFIGSAIGAILGLLGRENIEKIWNAFGTRIIPSMLKGAGVGVIIGGIIGAFGGPIGTIVGLLLGAAIGTIIEIVKVLMEHKEGDIENFLSKITDKILSFYKRHHLAFIFALLGVPGGLIGVLAGGFIGATLDIVWKAISKLFGAKMEDDFIDKAVKWVWKQILSHPIASIGGFIGGIAGAMFGGGIPGLLVGMVLGIVIGYFIEWVLKGIYNISKSALLWIGKRFSEAYDAIKSAFSSVISFFGKIYDIVSGFVSENIKAAVEGIQKLGKMVLDGFIWYIKKILLGGIFVDLARKFAPDFVDKVTSMLESVFNLITDIFSKIKNWVLDKWNKIKEFFGFGKKEEAIAQIPKIEERPYLSPEPVEITPLPAPVPAAQEPQTSFTGGGVALKPEEFAEGGLVTKPTLAMVGEKGPELIVPLNKNRIFPEVSINTPSINELTKSIINLTAAVNKQIKIEEKQSKEDTDKPNVVVVTPPSQQNTPVVYYREKEELKDKLPPRLNAIINSIFDTNIQYFVSDVDNFSIIPSRVSSMI